jgi:hypothetical protein
MAVAPRCQAGAQVGGTFSLNGRLMLVSSLVLADGMGIPGDHAGAGRLAPLISLFKSELLLHRRQNAV